MEYIVEKIGMTRTIEVPSKPVTLLKLVETQVCEIDGDRAVVAYVDGKSSNQSVAGQQKKYNLSPEYNRFATLKVKNEEAGALSVEPLSEAKVVKTIFKTKGRGFSGAMKRWNFAGGPAAHGSRFHRRVGSLGHCEWPGRVMPGRKMAGQYGHDQVTVKNEIVSFDVENGILALKGSIPGANGALGKVKVVK